MVLLAFFELGICICMGFCWFFYYLILCVLSLLLLVILKFLWEVEYGASLGMVFGDFS